MTVTLTYDDSLARVQIDATGLAGADHALVERSVDQVRWTTVRGAAEWPCSAGSFVRTLNDDEFAPGVINYYRVRGLVLDTMPSFVAAASASVGSSGSRPIAAPAGIIAGDLILIPASTRNSGTGTVDTPAGWDVVVSSGNVTVFGREYDGLWSMPTITYTNGAANEDTIAQAAAWRGVGLPALSTAVQLNASAQNIAYPLVNLPAGAEDATAVVCGWKADDWTSIATLAGMTEVQESLSTAGNDAAMVWDYQLDSPGIAAGSLVVTGGVSAISRGLSMLFPRQAYLNSQTGNVTPTLTSHWLKSVARPFLNMPVSLGPPRDRRYAARGTILDVINRTDPVGINDLRASAAFDLLVRTRDDAETQRLRNLLAGGDVLLLQAPPGSRYRTAYVTVGDVSEGLMGSVNPLEHWVLPCATTAAPEADVVGATTTCDTILADFATCSDVLATFATCVELMEYVADPADVIVP